METKECGSCRHWEPTAGSIQHGECCVLPPRVFLQHSGEFETRFPITAANERCGYWNSIDEGVEVKAEEPGGFAT